MKQKRNSSGETLLAELRQPQNINSNEEFAEGLDEINLDQGDAGSLGIDMTNERDTVTALTKKDHNDPLVVNVKDTSTGEITARKMSAIQVWYLKKEEKVMMELDGHGQGRDNGANLLVRFLGLMARRATLCPISIQRWDQMPEDNTKKQWNYIEENFEFDYAAGIKWALRTLGDRWKAYKYSLRNIYFYPNKTKEEILATKIDSDIPPIEWAAFVHHYTNPKTKKQCLQNRKNREKLQVSHAGGSKSNARRANEMEKKLGRPVCRSEVILSTLVKKNGNYVNGGHNLAEQILEHLPEDQERAAAEGVPSKVLAHPNDAIGKVFGAENVGRVRGFSSAVCPVGFGKSKRIFGFTTGGVSSNVSQQHVLNLEKQVETLEKKLDGYEETKIQLAALHKFLSSKYGDEVPNMSGDMSDI
ncbi:uncharacterized protein LOC130980319 [Arachis stenosperma]|uniref:uncharacterized protein LOC130980319 n=1 Tax=Arachis stenosperma TaxID=217475 RepID=UPI0025AD9B54|nr:uncharacterized protein LOC130980319 [Arachis stenosperma]